MCKKYVIFTFMVVSLMVQCTDGNLRRKPPVPKQQPPQLSVMQERIVNDYKKIQNQFKEYIQEYESLATHQGRITDQAIEAFKEKLQDFSMKLETKFRTYNKYYPRYYWLLRGFVKSINDLIIKVDNLR